MAYKTIIEPKGLPVHLDVVKDHLKVTSTDEDSLITSYVSGAVELLQAHTNRQLITTVKDYYLDALKTCIKFTKGPISKISAVYYIDEDDNEQTLSSSLYDVDLISAKSRIIQEKDSTYPDVKTKPNAVRIRHTAGYVTPFTVEFGTDTVTAYNHTFSNGDTVELSNSGGALPNGYSTDTTYYVVNATTDTLQLSATSGGDAIDISGTGTGSHYLGVLPENFINALLLIVGHLYHYREDTVSKMPKASEYLLKNYVIY